MKDTSAADATGSPWPRLWRMFLIGLCALILCSCQASPRRCDRAAVCNAPGYSSLPPEAYTGAPAQGPGPAPECAPMGPPGMELGVPLPYEAIGPWSPPGIARPWPPDEYIRDGGDFGLPARVGDQWEVQGLEVEDAIAHYDTLDGRTVVEPANPVYIYSPRFGAVRQVVSLVANEQMVQSAGVYMPVKLVRYEESLPALNNRQNIQANAEIAGRPPVAMRSRQGDGAMSSAVKAKGFHDGFKPYENLAIIRQGVYESAEMAFLASGVNAALAWTHTQAVQIILDRQTATAVHSDEKLELLFTVKPPAEPQLRVIKVASTPFAEPGEEVDFTIRFDNLGNQPLGNVTIIDNLSTRLEYIPDSAQCSRDAQFSTQPNEGDSVALRCEVTDPLEVGKGGVLRFRCRVR